MKIELHVHSLEIPSCVHLTCHLFADGKQVKTGKETLAGKIYRAKTDLHAKKIR